MKICSKCNIRKGLSHFRIRTDKRENPPLVYHQSQCRKCDAEAAKIYRKNNPEKVKQQVKSYQKNNRDKINARTREYKRKNNKRILEYRKSYYLKNKKKIDEQQRKTRKKYSDYHKDNLTDKYINRKLIGKHGVTVQFPEVLIKAKRKQIELLRLLNK